MHPLAALSRTIPIAKMVKELKRSSTLWVKEQEPTLRNFAWQNVYGAFSIDFSQLEEVRSYISQQPEHHLKLSFQDEFRLFLQRYDIPFDEQYFWD